MRLLVPTLNGWMGDATVIEDQGASDPVVDFLKDDPGESGATGFAHWRDLGLIEAQPDTESASAS
ncbi:MAG: hypothetical protein ACOYB3_05570 [Azonexus sp.]